MVVAGVHESFIEILLGPTKF
eukprot:SAG11_NODE_25250_length_361_cov_1.095420_1_plen_20_part_01